MSLVGRLGPSVKILLTRAGPLQFIRKKSAHSELLYTYRNPKAIDTWTYRGEYKARPIQIHIVEGLMAAMWYWILWHCWYDTGMLFGHFDNPDPSKWTDEELGIPPDDAD